MLSAWLRPLDPCPYEIHCRCANSINRLTCPLDRLHEPHRTRPELLLEVLGLAIPDAVLARASPAQPYRAVHHVMHRLADHREFLVVGEEREGMDVSVTYVAVQIVSICQGSEKTIGRWKGEGV